MAITKLQIQVGKEMAAAFEKYDTENSSDFIQYDASQTTKRLPVDLIIDSQKLITDTAYRQSFDRFADTIIGKLKEKGIYQGFKEPKTSADTDMKNMVEFLDNFNDDTTHQDHYGISVPLGQPAIVSFADETKYPNSRLFFIQTDKSVADGKVSRTLCEFDFDLNKFYTDAKYNAGMKSFLNAVIIRFNDKFGKKSDSAFLTTEQTEAAIQKSVGRDMAALYNFADAIITENFVVAPAAVATVPGPVGKKKLADNVTEQGVFTTGGLETLPKAWFDQHLTNDTRDAIAKRFGDNFLSGTKVYDLVLKDGVSVKKLEPFIWSNPESDTSYKNQALRAVSGESDDILRGVISDLQNNTRVFTVDVTLDDDSTAQVQVFVDTTTGFVATNSGDAESTQAIYALRKSVPGSEDADYSPLYHEINNLIITYGYKMGYYEK